MATRRRQSAAQRKLAQSCAQLTAQRDAMEVENRKLKTQLADLISLAPVIELLVEKVTESMEARVQDLVDEAVSDLQVIR